MPADLTRDPDRAAQNGEEAVIEYLLLCRCNYLVHNLSSIPRTVLLTVPDMPATNIDEQPLLRRVGTVLWQQLAIRRRRRTNISELPALPSPNRWDLIEGLRAEFIQGSAVVSGQQLLRLVAVGTDGRHALGGEFGDTALAQSIVPSPGSRPIWVPGS